MSAEHRYKVVMHQYQELLDAAIKVLEATDARLEGEKAPLKFTSAWGALAELSRVIAKHHGARS